MDIVQQENKSTAAMVCKNFFLKFHLYTNISHRKFLEVTLVKWSSKLTKNYKEILFYYIENKICFTVYLREFFRSDKSKYNKAYSKKRNSNQSDELGVRSVTNLCEINSGSHSMPTPSASNILSANSGWKCFAIKLLKADSKQSSTDSRPPSKSASQSPIRLQIFKKNCW